MMAFIKWIISRWWPIALVFSISAVAYLRIAEADDYSRRHWTRIQSEDLSVANLDSRMRYFCVAGMAFDLGGDNDPIDLFEHRIVIVDAKAKKLCLPPWSEAAGGSEILMSATSPESGWGTMLIRADKPLPRAVDETKKRLGRAGWRETPASTVAGQKRIELQAAMYEKGASWLLVSAVLEPGGDSTNVLLAGRFEP